MRPQARKKRIKEYFLPFTIIIAAGMIFVFCLNFYRSLNERPYLDELRLLVLEGQAKIESWGSNQWRDSLRGDRVLGGDKVRTSNNAKILLRFMNDFEMRLGADTQLNIEEVFDEKNNQRLTATLGMGNLWIEHANGLFNMNDIKFEVDTDDVVSVEQTATAATVRVMGGSIDVDVLKITDTKTSVVDTITLVKGQEAVFDEETLGSFREYQRPYVEEDIDNGFYKSPWYLWNQQVTEQKSTYEDLDEQPLQQDGFLDLDPPAKPIVISPPNMVENEEYIFVGDELILTGNTDTDTFKMKVLYSVGNIQETHALLQFQSGSGLWTYKISAARGNLHEGLNSYKVLAIDALGNESDPLSVLIKNGESSSVLTEDGASEDVKQK